VATNAAAFAPVVGDGVRPGRPKTLTAAFVPCLRIPMPVLTPLPALVLPVIDRQMLVSPAALPESTRMPLRFARVGAATVLF
jgi:hypothetical protein